MRNLPAKIVLATRNPGKLKEILAIFGDLPIEWRTLNDYPLCPEAEESGSSYLENAREKARLAANFCGEWALADDSGLEVEALGGEPGVRSARYAGEGATSLENNEKLLRGLAKAGRSESPAEFRCVMVLRGPLGEEFSSEGRWRGRIALCPQGDHGFGYDPIFFLPELGKTAAELLPEEKNRLSHRAQVLKQMRRALDEGHGPGIEGTVLSQ